MMHDPSHPGEVIKHDCIEASQLTVTDAADGLGVSRKPLSSLLTASRASRRTWPSGLKKQGGGLPTHG